jgi:uncharacterized protein (DUF1015 family)
MADVQPFRGYRYNLAQVGALEDVIAPPYDVIDSALQEELYAKNPANVVRLILNKETPNDTELDNRYTRSAACLRDWLANDILLQESQRSIYAVEQRFEVDGRILTRKGFLARVKLEPFGQGSIFPHEETLSGPKADRLKLFRATAMNLSPVFGLYPDPTAAVPKLLDQAIGRALPIEATDHLGVVTRIWPLADHHLVNQITALIADKPVFLADGHHRYETGLKYLSEREQQATLEGRTLEPDAQARYILMFLVAMSDKGLEVQPTHRLVRGLPGISTERLRELLEPAFDIAPFGKGEEGCKAAWEEIEMGGEQDVLAFGTRSDSNWFLARLKDQATMEQVAPGKSDAWRALGVAILHGVALDGLLKPHAGPDGLRCTYVHQAREVIEDQASAQGADIAVLVPPATIDMVEEIAGGGEKMPPKSTYFYPKIPSGLVFNPLK